MKPALELRERGADFMIEKSRARHYLPGAGNERTFAGKWITASG
jgi:hypothetical protein